jgi:hypothetical protein
LKQKIVLCAGALAFGLTASAAAMAQPVPPYYPGIAYPGAVYPGYAAALPPHEIVAIVRSTGLEPSSRPLRYGLTYALRAVDPAGQEVQVVVDARLGRIVRVVPIMAGRYAAPVMPPPYGRPPGEIAMVPDGYGPNSRIAVLPPGVEGPPVNGPGAIAPPRPAAQSGRPPLPRPRPKVATVEAPAANSSTAKPVTGAAPETKDITGAITTPATAVPPPADEQHE